MKLNPLRRRLPGERAATRDIQTALQQLQAGTLSRVSALSGALAKPHAQLPTEIADAFAYVQATGQAITSLQRCLAGSQDELSNREAPPGYMVSSLFVLELNSYLPADPQGRERMVYLTGPVAPDGTAVLSTMHKIPMVKQSAAYVQADTGASAAFLEDLTANKRHQLWAMFHNHPMSGREGTRPSATDLAHQERLVKIGLTHTLGGIFSRDGWLRVFSTARDFSLSIYGAGVELVDDRPREKILRIDPKEIAHVAAKPVLASS